MTKKIAIITFFIFTLSTLLSAFSVTPTFAAIELVKSADFGTVYYLDNNSIRHPFPNETTYRSWYGSDFSKIVTVSNDFLSQYPLGKNITIRPGTYLVKIRTAPQVYAVEQGGVLREIVDESVAEAIYGKSWAKRVIDVPDVFFDNYVLGSPLKYTYKIPEDVLYKSENSETYYYKKNNILQPFSSVEAVKANYFSLTNAIVSNRSFFPRIRPITGFDKNVFDPVAVAVPNDSRDCENKKLKAAVIFVTDDSYSNNEIEAVQAIKTAVPYQFAWATDNLAEINFNHPTAVFYDDGYFLKKRNDGTTEVNNEVINSFYDNNPDIFDFLFIWTNFKIPSENTNEVARFIPVANKLEGTNKPSLDGAEAYGSTGKLKGIIMMGNINKYHPETASGLNEALNIVLHEIAHQFGAYIEFVDDSGQKSKALLRDDNYQHWSYYAGFVSPLGGSGWIDNRDGTFTSQLSLMSDSNLRKYSSLDLYLMGLIPYQLMAPVFYVEPEVPGTISNTIAGTAKWVSVDQIIKAHGQVKCGID